MFWLYIFVIVTLIILALSLLQGLYKGAPYIPTSKKVIRRMMEIANVKEGDLVIDFGSGDGRVLVVAAQEFGARAVGIEITLLYYLWSKLKVQWKGLSHRITVRKEDIHTADISGADVVILFLLQDTNQKLKEKLRRELRPGARIVSRYFTFEGWAPIEVDKDHCLYLYKV